MPQPRTTRPINRRVALGGAAGAAALGVAAGPAPARAASLENHPLTGTWLAMANPPIADDPQFAAPSRFAADGTVLLVFPATQKGPQGPMHASPAMGVWEPDGDRRGRFTAVQPISAPDGAFLGTVTIDGFPEVSEDGQTFVDDGSRTTVTMRDAGGAIVSQILPTGTAAGRPVTAVRMAVGVPGFPATGDATPTG